MPDPLNVILSLTQNHGFLRSGSRIVVALRDDSVREKWDRREEPVSPYFRSLTVILELDSELRFSKEWIPDRSSITG